MVDQAIASVFAAHPANPDVKMLVRTILSDPKSAQMSTAQILERLTAIGNQLPPADQVHVIELLDAIRGGL